MKLTSFRIRRFRNFIDSGEVQVSPTVTCLVGKNEAGKSGLLEALYLTSPAYDETYKVEEQYPRWIQVRDRKKGELSEMVVAEVTYHFEEDDIEHFNEVLGKGAITSKGITITRKYDGATWSLKHNDKIVIQHLFRDKPDDIKALVKDVSDDEELEELYDSIGANLKEGDEKAAALAASFKQTYQRLGFTTEDVWTKIHSAVKERLPKYFLFTNYSSLPGRINIQDLTSSADEGPGRSNMQTARALLNLAGTDAKQLAADDYEERKSELEAVQIELSNQVFEYWKQNPDLEVQIDVDRATVPHANGQRAVSKFLDIRMRDKRTGYSNNFSQRSSGFQWFFSFLAAFSEFEGKVSTIVLLDEPALTLHGRAQADFLRFIYERIAPSSQVIYTTHSPFMVRPDALDDVRVVEDRGYPDGACCHADIFANDPDSLFPLQAALGYDIAQNLFIGENNLVVEGTSDYIYLSVMSSICAANGQESLNENWRLIPAGGATNIPTFVSLLGSKLNITVFADSDTKGIQKISNLTASGMLNPGAYITASEVLSTTHADIEDLFSCGDYVHFYNETFGKNLKVSELPPGDRIVKRIESKEERFNHGLVAETVLRSDRKHKFSEQTLTAFESLFKRINETMTS